MNEYFISRQPVLDKGKTTFGYEFFFRGSPALDDGALDRSDSVGAMVDALTDVGFQRLVGKRTAFLDVNPDILESGISDLLPTRNCVLQVSDNAGPSSEFQERCRGLREKGYRICLNDFMYRESFSPILQFASFAKVDIARYDRRQLLEILNLIKRLPVKAVALHVETRDDYNSCLELGFGLFQGHFFARPSVIAAKSISPSQALLMELSNLISKNADVQTVEGIFKKNPELTFGLLKLINSAFFALKQKITSIRQTIALLGYDNLQKWVTLLLFSIDHNDTRADPLLEKVLMRGRMMELLAEKAAASATVVDSAFITGILSLINVLFGLSLQDITAKLNLAKEIQDALIERKGLLGMLLLLVEKLDEQEYGEVNDQIGRVNLTVGDLLSVETRAVLEYQASVNAEESP